MLHKSTSSIAYRRAVIPIICFLMGVIVCHVYTKPEESETRFSQNIVLVDCNPFSTWKEVRRIVQRHYVSDIGNQSSIRLEKRRDSMVISSLLSEPQESSELQETSSPLTRNEFVKLYPNSSYVKFSNDIGCDIVVKKARSDFFFVHIDPSMHLDRLFRLWGENNLSEEKILIFYD